MNSFNSVFRLLELIHVPSSPNPFKTKKQKYNDGFPAAGERTSLSLQDISIPEQKMRVGLPPGVCTSTSNNSNSTSSNINNSFNYSTTTTYSPINQNFSHPRPTQPPQPPDPRRGMEARILHLWKKVWLGLYQIDNAQGPYHYERIEALYLGAGLTRNYRVGELKVLNQHFFEYSRNRGVAGLKMYENLSMKMLKAVIEILEAYEREISSLEKIYAILRGAQLDLYQEDGFGGFSAQIQQTQRRYLGIAEPMEKRLLHYDARTDVLIMDIYDEAMELHPFHPGLRRGLYVYQKAFGRR